MRSKGVRYRTSLTVSQCQDLCKKVASMPSLGTGKMSRFLSKLPNMPQPELFRLENQSAFEDNDPPAFAVGCKFTEGSKNLPPTIVQIYAWDRGDHRAVEFLNPIGAGLHFVDRFTSVLMELDPKASKLSEG